MTLPFTRQTVSKHLTVLAEAGPAGDSAGLADRKVR
jgi:hypothetical protein